MSGRTLKVKCATWDHVENFYAQKIKPGKLLSARVPFNPRRGSGVTLAVELPNELVIAIECEVREVKPAPDGKRSAVVLYLAGLSAELVERLKTLVGDGRADQRPARRPTEPPPLVRKEQSRTPSTELPVPIPTDAPIDEIIEVAPAPRIDDVAAGDRPVFIDLDKHLRSLREAAAHDVLGVTWDASVVEIRTAYFDLTKKYHPDVFSKHRSPAISTLSQELFIYINKAYDRLRDAAVEAGYAIAAGPALLEHNGWFAGFDDFGSSVRSRAVRIDGPKPAPKSAPEVPESQRGRAGEGPVTVRFAKGIKRPLAPPPIPKPRAESQLDAGSLFGDVEAEESRVPTLDMETPEGGLDDGRIDDLGRQARKALGEEQFDHARDVLAKALGLDPRRRELRALYHVAYGMQLARDGKNIDARTQFEAAMVHDRDCSEAQQAMAELGAPARKGGLFRRLFK